MKIVSPHASRKSPAEDRGALRRPATERGVALVITLILLSVTLIMAVAFLALSRRERESVSTSTDATQARLAADSALAAAEAQLVANIFATSNSYNYGLFVSTNYINPSPFGFNGFDTTLGYLTNINVNYYSGNYFLTGDALAQNIASLQILPRAPVFVPTSPTNSDFRFYLDLNRNGHFDTNGFAAEVVDTNTGVADNTNFEVGDPEWVGILERPGMLHSPVNKFTSRYAFFAAPVGNGLDINAIHNQAGSEQLNAANDGYIRNQGVGSWELNLAGFFADLNANIWSPATLPNNSYYAYNWPNGSANLGSAFDDARSILNYRYNGNYNTLISAANSFANGATAFLNNRIDEYGAGPLQITLNTNAADGIALIGTAWPGANNINQFYSLPAELFDGTKTSQLFTNRLTRAGLDLTNNYDRYTFYRLLAQLGTDSSVEHTKLNLNYVNVDNNGNIVPGMETNLLPWTNALMFFTNAADRMLHVYTTNWYNGGPSNYLATYYNAIYYGTNLDGYGWTNYPCDGFTNAVPGFGIGNIPVYINGKFVYSPAVNRVLQLAANIYDASTNSIYPSVFRPIFNVYVSPPNKQTNIYICGYVQVTPSTTSIAAGTFPLTAPDPISYLPFLVSSGSLVLSNINVYGVPWIIGAKKNLPGFYQFSMINQVQVSRELQFTRISGTVLTNQNYIISVSNNMGVNFWNPYANTYYGNLGVYFYGNLTMGWSNSPFMNFGYSPFPYGFSNALSSWSGAGWNFTSNTAVSSQTPLSNSFVSFNWSHAFIPLQSFYPSSGIFPGNGSNSFDPGPLVNLPQIELATTNLMYGYILDGNHVLDYVTFATPSDISNITNALADSVPGSLPTDPAPPTPPMWTIAPDTKYPAISYGIWDQISVSISGGATLSPANLWTADGFPDGAPTAQQDELTDFFANNPNSPAQLQAAYTPTRTLVYPYLLQANDPLVHYMSADLNGIPGSTASWNGNTATFTNGVWLHLDPNAIWPTPPLNAPLGRYQPWGVSKQMAGIASVNTNISYDTTFRDSLIQSADYWDFPTNIYPTVGWLGRVHRGTPWQTVYLKASNVLPEGTNVWGTWTGNQNPFDATNEAPYQDRLLFDVFTTKLNDNATRGTLSVNQTNFAAWSALFSGLVAITNTTAIPKVNVTPTTGSKVISPAGISIPDSVLWQIYTNINGTRNLYPGQIFAHVGDILSAPLMTEQSPFLNKTATFYANQPQKGISDEMYEWLPQQTLGLLRDSSNPRYVIYGYGQALRPASGALYSGSISSLFGLVTNYQVTAESAVRAVVEVHPQVTAGTNGFFITNYTTTVENYDVLPPD